MVTILTIESEFESAESLGYKTVMYCDPRTEDTVIRWGNSEIVGPEYRKVVNPSKAISLNCHKLKALLKMSEVVKTPQTFTENVPSNRLVLIRPINHSNGDGFRVIRGPKPVPREHYGTTWVKTKTEYRVWFAWDQTACAKRVPITIVDGQPVEPEPIKKFPCRSGWGYKFLEKTPDKLHDDVMKAAKKIGLDIGAADVLVKGEEFIFLELNSAPTVDDTRIREFYQNAINSRVS